MAQTLAVADCSTSLSMADSCETSDASVLKERTSSRALSDVVSIEYPLKRRWTFWYLNDKRDLFWEKRLKIVTTISSVDEFWGMHMSIRPPSLLPSSCDYNLFKENIQPMWEVPENSNGGRWIVAVDRSRPPEVLDAVWLEVMLMIIGEQFGVYMEGICGIICNIRNKGSKVSIWTRDARNVDTIMQIGEILKEKLKSQSGGMRWAESITFEEHQANRQNSARKNVHRSVYAVWIMVLEFIKRHRGKFTFGTVAVGALLAIKGANRGAYVSKFIELSSVHQRCRAEEAMKLYTSDNRHRRCDTLIISLLNTVREKIEERFPIETLTEELRNERRYAKVLLIWQEIKVNTFARIMTASYAMSLITVAMKSQMSILINQINWSNSKSEETSENQTFVSELFNYFFATENLRPASEKSLIVQAKTERIYFQCIVYFVQYGLKDFMKFVHSVCREETSTVDFKRKYNWNEFYDLLKSIQQRIHMADSRNFSRLIVPEFSSFLNQQSSFSIQVDMDEENLSSNMGLSILLNRNMEMLESTKSKEATSAFVDMFIRAALLPIKGNGNSGPLELALILPLLSNDFRRLFRSDFDAVIQNVLCSTELHELCVYVSSLPPL